MTKHVGFFGRDVLEARGYLKRRSLSERSELSIRGRKSLASIFALGLAACAGPAPDAAPAPGDAETLQRAAEPPAPMEERPVEFPEFRETTLENGLRVIVVEHRAQPVANVNLYVDGGSALDPVERLGIAGLTASLLTKGTPTRSAVEISETIERVGGRLSASAGGDRITISSTVLSDDLELAFDLVGDVTLRPTFPEEELETERGRALSALQLQLGQGPALAGRRYAATVYGEDHPYGMSRTPETVRGIERADLVRLHDEIFSAGNALLVVSGNVSLAEVETLATEHFGDWQAGEAVEPEFVQPPEQGETRIHLVNRPGSSQTSVRVGHLGIRPDNPDYFPLQVLNHIVGGRTDSRLFQILREEKGWTYGAYSSFSRPADIGTFTAQAEVRPEVTDSAVAEILHQLQRVRDEEVSAENLEAATGYLAGSFPLSIETPGQIAGQVASAVLLGLPMEYLTEYRERILEVGVDDVQRVAREYLHPERAAVVVVGDAPDLLERLEAIAPVALYDVEGAPLDRAELEMAPTEQAWDGSRLSPMTQTYAFTVQGNAMGSVTYTLERDGDAWRGTSSMDSPMMRQNSEVRFTADDLAPLASTQTVSAQGAEMHADLRVENGQLVGEASDPENGEQSFDQEMPAGALLPGMDMYVLAAADLEEGARFSLPVFDTSSGAARPVSYSVSGIETVEVPAGSFAAYRVEVSGGEMPMVIFLRQEAPHLLVKQEFAGAPVSIELESMD